MALPHTIGMYENIQQASRHLTDDGEFRLETIAYGTYPKEFRLILVSKEISIFFHGLNYQYPGINATFYIPSQGRIFFSEYLFPATGVDIAHSKRLSISNVMGIFYRDPQPQIEHRHNYDKKDETDFVSDLERLCYEIKKNWTKIQILFNADNIDETIRLYSLEYQKRWRKDPHITTPSVSNYITGTPLKRSKEFIKKDVPSLEDIIQALEPLDSVCDHSTITSHMLEGRVDVTTYFKNGTSLRLFFHTNENGETELYFTLIPNLNFLMNREDLRAHNRAGVLSGKNVFSFLGIEYVYHPKGFMEDIREYSQLIHANSDKIIDALVKKSENTYTLLKDIPGNNEDEINRVFDGLMDLIDR